MPTTEVREARPRGGLTSMPHNFEGGWVDQAYYRKSGGIMTDGSGYEARFVNGGRATPEKR